MKKKVWITSLSKNEEQVKTMMGLVQKYGLQPEGHFWVDDVKKMAWLAPKDNLIDPETSLWMILGSEKDIGTDSVCYGLALLAITVQAQKSNGFPIMWICTEGEVTPDKLPTPLNGADIFDVSNPSLGAKLTVKANAAPKKVPLEYRLDLHANVGFGLWFEIGPVSGQEWTGALLGVDGAEINFQGVGSAGKLPDKAVLEYPIQGMKLELRDKEYTAWAVKNKLDENNSYYARVEGMAKSILFGPFSEDEQADVYTVDLF
jgi:hypothetical protein